jgi:DNA-binding transcriptional ArsR family regulator
MPSEQEDGRIVLSDPRAIRALAHPARLAIIEALLPGEELTATECASLTGLSPSATSYHLKALERWGIVAPGHARNDGRDRPWKARGRSIEVSSDVPQSSMLVEAAVLEVFLDRNRALAAQFLEHRVSEPAQWRDVMELGNGDYWLTAGELAEISAALRRVLEPYEHRRAGSRPDGSRRVRIARLIVPRADSPAPKDAGPG